MSLRQKFVLLIGSLILVVGYTNCSSQGFEVLDKQSLQVSGEGGTTTNPTDNTTPPSGSTGSSGSTGGATCEDDLLKVYKNSYHAFLSKTCVACHVNGPGVGAFASSDVQTSIDSFLAIGVDKIKANAVNPNHKPPVTGTQNQTQVNNADVMWNAGVQAYNTCMAQQSGGGGITNPSTVAITTTEIQVPSNLSNYSTLSWDLESQSDGKVPLIAEIRIKSYIYNDMPIGYSYAQLTLRLKSSGLKYHTADVQILVNGVVQSDVTAYANVNMVISSTSAVILGEANMAAINVRQVSSTDRISLRFSNLSAQ